MSLADLERGLAAGRIARTYLVLGDTVPLVDRATEAVFAAVRPKLGAVAFNHNRFRATDPDAHRAFEAARTLPMMGELRLVEVRDLHEAPTAVWTALLHWLEAPASSGVVLCVGTGFPKVEKGGSNWSSRVKNALGDGVLCQVSAKDQRPQPFAQQVARSRGKTLAPAEAQMLVELLGDELGRLQQEVEKLCDYVGDAPAIRAEDIAAATASLAEADVWVLTAALVAGNRERALGTLHRLFESGEDAHRLFGLVTWQLRDAARIADLARAGASEREIVARLELQWNAAKRVPDVMGAVQRGTFPDGAELLRRLATANRQMNGHRAGPQRVLEGFLLELLSGRVRRPPPVPRPR